MDLYFIPKIILILILWSLIVLCFLFIINSKKISAKVKKLEEKHKKRRLDFVHNYSPVLYSLKEQGKSINNLFHLKQSSVKETILSFTDIIHSLVSYQGATLKVGIKLLKKLLK